MTTEHEASRTLVKSPPELWAECSDPGSLARHLGEFGEITITKLEPESAVAWEGEHASGTVRIEPSGWGTRVTLTAQTEGEEPEVAPEAGPTEQSEPVSYEPEPETDQEESDATVEEMVEDPQDLPPADPHARARWRRIKARMRGLFRADEPGEASDGESLDAIEDSIPPPPAEPETEAEAAPDVGDTVEPEPEANAETDAPAPEAVEPQLDPEAILTSALDSLGQAHHRPFSRA